MRWWRRREREWQCSRSGIYLAHERVVQPCKRCKRCLHTRGPLGLEVAQRRFGLLLCTAGMRGRSEWWRRRRRRWWRLRSVNVRRGVGMWRCSVVCWRPEEQPPRGVLVADAVHAVVAAAVRRAAMAAFVADDCNGSSTYRRTTPKLHWITCTPTMTLARCALPLPLSCPLRYVAAALSCARHGVYRTT